MNLGFTKPENFKIQPKKPGRRRLRVFATGFSGFILSFFLAGCFMMYGPFAYPRNLWIATALETLHHQWLATAFFDSKTVDAVRALSVVVPVVDVTDPGLITTSGPGRDSRFPADNATELPEKAEDGEHIVDGIGYSRLKGDFGEGWLIKVYDPSRVTMGISQDFGKKGERISSMVTRLGALAGINAGGFVDLEGHGNGGNPDQIVIYNGDEIQKPTSPDPHHVIGITYQNKLVLGTYTNDELLNQNFKYGIEFWPFIIMDGKPLDYGYNSFNPRTAIGQTKDGTFLFVVIDGRSVRSRGATMQEVQRIMEANGAVNAANLDGGSSTAFVYKGKVMNIPSTPIGERYVPDAFLITPSGGDSSVSLD